MFCDVGLVQRGKRNEKKIQKVKTVKKAKSRVLVSCSSFFVFHKSCDPIIFYHVETSYLTWSWKCDWIFSLSKFPQRTRCSRKSPKDRTPLFRFSSFFIVSMCRLIFGGSLAPLYRIALTGGPCGGKSSSLKHLTKSLNVSELFFSFLSNHMSSYYYFSGERISSLFSSRNPFNDDHWRGQISWIKCKRKAR